MNYNQNLGAPVLVPHNLFEPTDYAKDINTGLVQCFSEKSGTELSLMLF